MSRYAKSALLCSTIIFAVIGVVAAIILFNTSQVPEVDLTETAQQDDSAEVNDQRPPLRVAIGAMISPGITKKYYNDILRLIGDKIGRRIVLIQRKTYSEVNTLIEQRKIDLAYVCSGPYVQGHDKFGLEILAVPVVDGKTVYHSYIITHIDSDIRTFDDLRGKRFAFTDPDSNTGCLVPRYMLAMRNETPETFFKETFFTYSHDNSIKAVSEKLADGAAVDSLIWEFMRETAPATVEKTVVIHKSPPYGIPPLVIHPDMDARLKKQLRHVILTLHEDERAKVFLDKLRIDRADEGSDALYKTVREMQNWQKKSH